LETKLHCTGRYLSIKFDPIVHIDEVSKNPEFNDRISLNECVGVAVPPVLTLLKD